MSERPLYPNMPSPREVRRVIRVVRLEGVNSHSAQVTLADQNGRFLGSLVPLTDDLLDLVLLLNPERVIIPQGTILPEGWELPSTINVRHQ